ncbi:hypothetical protein BH23PLA1_BH23PLA1_41880 [soil metagenome]
MDVFCVGMYRSCSTWQYEVVGHLLERHRGCRRLGYREGPDYAAAVEGGSNPTVPLVLKSHDKHPVFGKALVQRRAKGVYAYRDLRDVAFSMQHKMGLPLDRLIRQGLIDRILANDRFWTSRPGVLVQRYEDLLAEPARGVEQIAEHLGAPLADGEASAIASEYSLEANRKRTEAMRTALQGQGIDLNDSAQQLRYDGQTLLHWNHLREGKVGGWQASITPRQRLLLGRLCGPWLIEKGYEPDDAWWWNSSMLTASSTAWIEKWALLREMARSRFHCAVYFNARRYPRIASALKRALGLDRPEAISPATPVPIPTPHHLPSEARSDQARVEARSA